MDITPIYDLRARLRASMIAGTNLLSEDFRLKRAIEAISPLEQASPVFAKIGQLSRSLIEPGQPDREGALLDTITLVDAVLCTQGVVAADPGAAQEAGPEIQKLPGNAWGSVVTNAPYSVVSALSEALTSSGSGHFSYVTATHETRPELFLDYRIKAAMVQALGASYSELAELVETWLKEEDASILPLLQNQFDPGGKKEMVRRVRVMEAIAPKEANDFFVEKIEDAKKEVRQALIYALRHCPKNEGLLWDLSKTEKGNSKQAVYHALVQMESEQAKQFFQDLYQTKPQDAMQYLQYAKSSWAARLVAEKLEEQMQPLEDKKAILLTEEQSQALQIVLAAIAGKTGPEMIEALRKTIRLSDKPNFPLTDLVNAIQKTLLQTADPEMCRFVIEIYEEKLRNKEDWEPYFPLAALGHLFMDEDCSVWLADQLTVTKRFFTVKQPSVKLYASLYQAWKTISWSETKRAFILQEVEVNSAVLDGSRTYYVHTLKQDMAGRITDILMQCRDGKLDTLLEKYISRENEAYRAKLGEYYHKRALEVSDNRFYAQALKIMGYMRCEGIAVQYFKHSSDKAVPIWSLKYYVNSFLPGDNQAKYKEMQKVYELVQKKRIKLQNSANAEQDFLAFLEELK